MTGSRELVLGALGAGLAGAPAARAAWRWGVLVDALDVIAVTASWRAGRHDTGSWALLAGAGVGAVAAGLHAAAG